MKPPDLQRSRGTLLHRSHAGDVQLLSCNKEKSAGFDAGPTPPETPFFSSIPVASFPSPQFAFTAFLLLVQVASSTVDALAADRNELSSRFEDLKSRQNDGEEGVGLF